MGKTVKLEKKISALMPGDFGAIEHKVPRFNADVPGTLTKEDLENPDLWAHVGRSMTMGCDVRCMADDMSFVAFGTCTFAQGSSVKIKIYSFNELDEVNYDEMNDEAAKFIIKLRGSKKWCIVNNENGDIVKTDIPTQLEAMRELTDYQKALRA